MFLKKSWLLLLFISNSLFAQVTENSKSFDYLSSGKYHRILQYRISLMEAPSEDSNIVAILNLNDEIEILENSGIEEQINGIWGYWYKIECYESIGYIFGGHLSVFSFENKYGLFYFRVSECNPLGSITQWRTIDSHIDIFIYINGQQINTERLKRHYYRTTPPEEYIKSWHESDWHKFNFCIFEEKDELVLINLVNQYMDGNDTTTYSIDRNGNIEFIEWTYYGRVSGNPVGSLLIFTKNDGITWERYLSDHYEHNENNIIEKIIDDDGVLWIRRR